MQRLQNFIHSETQTIDTEIWGIHALARTFQFKKINQQNYFICDNLLANIFDVIW